MACSKLIQTIITKQKQEIMKKITSFLSLVLIFSVTLLLASCNECVGVSGGGGSFPADVQQKLDKLAADLANEAQKVDALASNALGDVTYDPETGQWYYSTPGSSTKTPLTPTQAFKVTIGSNGNWYINGVDTGWSSMGTPGTPGMTPTVTIDPTTKNWVINGTDTGVKAEGTDGATPTVAIGSNGNWYINGSDTGISATGPAGPAGTTPTIGANGNWWIGTTDTGIAATGPQGPAGADGTTPTIGANGNWFIGTTDTGIAAQGPQGPQGPAGADGKSGILDGQGVYVNYMDGTTEKTIYIPQFVSNPDGTTTITVGGTTYIIPASGGGCTCNWSLTNTGGSWTISDGTNSVKIPTVPDWVNTTEVTYNTTTNQFEITSGTNKVAIPKGYADVTVDATSGVATITSADGTTSIKLQKTQPVVYTVDGSDDVYVQNYDLDGNPVGSAYALPTAGQFSTLTNTVNGINTDLTKIKAQIGNWDETQGSITDSIASLDNRVTTLQSEVNSLFEKMLQALAYMITNIQIEEVNSNAIGTYNGVLTNLKTTKLIGYFGTTDEIIFPKHDPVFYKPAGDPTMLDTLGTLNLTVNPIGTDFSGISVSLVNSIGEESKIKLTNLASSDKKLVTGITRAAGTGLYETKATVAASDIYDPRLAMAIDLSAVKTAVKDTYNDLVEVYKQKRLGAFKGETINEIANAIYSVVDGISTERLAVKTSYTYTTTDLNGNSITSTKSVVSPYDISGVMVKPLGFESLPENWRDTIDHIKLAKKLLKRANTRVAKKIINTIEEYTNLSHIEQQIADLQVKIKKVQPVPEEMKIIKQIVDIDTTITIKVPIEENIPVNIDTDIAIDIPVEVEYEYDLPENFKIVEDPANPGQYLVQYDTTHKTETTTVKVKDKVHFVYTDNVKIKETIETDVNFWIKKEFAIDITDMVDNVNNALDVVTSVDGLCESANSIIANIYKLEDKLLAGNYLNRINKYIDKAAAYTARGLYKLFLPVLLVNSDSGFGFAGIRGVPATVSGTVEVIPTTYSNGLVAPVYKKYISVNGADGQLVEGVKLDITKYLKSGTNTVEYYAVDYYGNEIGQEYVIIKK